MKKLFIILTCFCLILFEAKTAHLIWVEKETNAHSVSYLLKKQKALGSSLFEVITRGTWPTCLAYKQDLRIKVINNVIQPSKLH